ncbi:Exportin 1 family protein [Entamoeba marina]
MDQVLQAINTLYGQNQQNEQRTHASKFLDDFVKVPQAWNVFGDLLNTPSNDPLQIHKANYGALILQKKLMYQFDSVPQQQLPTIKEFIFQRILVFKQSGLVVKQLTLALIALALQDTTWEQFINSIIQHIPPTDDTITLLFAIFKEIGSSAEKTSVIDATMKSRFNAILLQSIPSIFDFVISSCNRNENNLSGGSDCLIEWIEHCNIPCSYYSNSQLLPFLFSKLSSSHCEKVSSVLVSIITQLTKTIKKEVSQADFSIILNLTSAFLENFSKYTTVVQQHPLQCFCEISFLLEPNLINFIQSQNVNYVNEHLKQLLLMSDTRDEDVIAMVSESAIVLLETPVTTRRKNISSALYQFFAPFAKEMMIKVITTHMDVGSRQGDDLLDFLQFRNGSSAYLLRKCVDCLGCSVSIEIIHHIFMNTQYKESCLSALLSCDEDFCQCDSPKLFEIFNLSFQNNSNPLFVETLLITIGRYARYFLAVCPNTIPSCASFVIQFLNKQRIGFFASQALERLSLECGIRMNDSFQQIMVAYGESVKNIVSQGLENREEEYRNIIFTVCNIANAQYSHELICQIFVEPLNVLLNSAQTRQLNVTTLTASWILKTIFRGLKELKQKKKQLPEILHILLSLASESKEMKAIDEITAVIGFMYRVIQASAQPFYQQTINCIANCFIQTQSPAAINCLSLIITSLSSYSQFHSMLRKTITPILLEAMNKVTINSNDLIIDCSDCLSYMIKIGMDEGLRKPSFMWLLQCISVPDRAAYRAVCDNLVSYITNKIVPELIIHVDVLEIVLQSVITLYSKDRMQDSIYLLREIYVADLPIKFQQTLCSETGLGKLKFASMMEEFFLLCKETL